MLAGLVRFAALPVAASAVGLVLGGLIMYAAGFDAVQAYQALFDGAFGTRANLGQTLTVAMPLLLVALGVTVGLKARFFNIGGEGQLYVGALAGTEVALLFGHTSWPYVIVPAMAAGALVGGLWALIAAVLKAKRGTNEIISTILMNYIGVGFVAYFINGPLRETPDSLVPWTPQVAPEGRLPRPGFLPVHVGFWIALGLAAVVSFLLYRTVLGYRIRVAGSSPGTARYVALPSVRPLLYAAFVSGGLAGVAGVIQILGVVYRVQQDFLPGVAFTAVAVALLGRATPAGVVLASIFIGGLFSGAQQMEVTTPVPSVIAYIIEALVILCVGAGLALSVHSDRGGMRRRLRLALRQLTTSPARGGGNE